MTKKTDPTSEDNHLGGRLKRYAHVSAALTRPTLGFVFDQIFGKEGSAGDAFSQAHLLTQALGSLKGPVMKIAQLLGTIPDALPTEYAQAFLTLQSQAPPMGKSFVQRRMKGELGEDWSDKFAFFDSSASAAASLGQVHKATSLQGAPLACKLQYPNMASTVEADLHQLRLVLKLYEATVGALKVTQIFEEVVDRLREELDYTLEARHMRLYAFLLRSLPDVCVPVPDPALSTPRLLTMSWLEGAPLKHVLDRPQEARNQMAQTLFRAWYLPFYYYGVLHGDPHLGNYTFDAQGRLNLLDFGCIRAFSPRFVQGVITLYESLRDQNADQEASAYEIWGFKNLSSEMIQVLRLWARMLYEPLLEDRVRPIQPSHKGTQGRQMAARVHQELRRLGGVEPPREFVLMDRAAVGIGSAFMHLGAELNWHQEFERLIDAFDPQALAHRQAEAFQHAGLGQDALVP